MSNASPTAGSSMLSWPTVFGGVRARKKLRAAVAKLHSGASPVGTAGDAHLTMSTHQTKHDTAHACIAHNSADVWRQSGTQQHGAADKRETSGEGEGEGDGDGDGDGDAPSLRRRILAWMLSWEFELGLLVLLAIDIVLLIVELELATRVVCHIRWASPGGNGTVDSRSALGIVNCSAAPPLTVTCEDSRVFSLPANFSVCPFYVNEELPYKLHKAEVGIAWASRSVLACFVVELVALLLCAGPRLFWTHKLYLLDAAVVSASIAFEIVAASMHIDRIAELFVIMRVWRFARIVHGVGVTVHDVDEHELSPHGETGVGVLPLAAAAAPLPDLIKPLALAGAGAEAQGE